MCVKLDKSTNRFVTDSYPKFNILKNPSKMRFTAYGTDYEATLRILKIFMVSLNSGFLHVANIFKFKCTVLLNKVFASTDKVRTGMFSVDLKT